MVVGEAAGGCSACVICPETSHGHKREAVCPRGFGDGGRAMPLHALRAQARSLPHRFGMFGQIPPTFPYIADTSGCVCYARGRTGASVPSKADRLKALFHSWKRQTSRAKRSKPV